MAKEPVQERPADRVRYGFEDIVIHGKPNM
jgi:hypothetical protein